MSDPATIVLPTLSPNESRTDQIPAYFAKGPDEKSLPLIVRQILISLVAVLFFVTDGFGGP